jgi:hypothetical protein
MKHILHRWMVCKEQLCEKKECNVLISFSFLIFLYTVFFKVFISTLKHTSSLYLNF